MEWNVNLDSKSSAHVKNMGIGVYSGCYCDPGVTVSRGVQVALTESPAGCLTAQSRDSMAGLFLPESTCFSSIPGWTRGCSRGKVQPLPLTVPKILCPPKGATEGTEEGSSREKKLAMDLLWGSNKSTC